LERNEEKMESLFELLVLSLANATLVGLGLLEDPESQYTSIHMEDARSNIEMLEMLTQKTKGNLTAEEQKLVDSVMYDLRMKFVEVTKNLC
jgi:hypothetical protein